MLARLWDRWAFGDVYGTLGIPGSSPPSPAFAPSPAGVASPQRTPPSAPLAAGDAVSLAALASFSLGPPLPAPSASAAGAAASGAAAALPTSRLEPMCALIRLHMLLYKPLGTKLAVARYPAPPVSAAPASEDQGDQKRASVTPSPSAAAGHAEPAAPEGGAGLQFDGPSPLQFLWRTARGASRHDLPLVNQAVREAIAQYNLAHPYVRYIAAGAIGGLRRLAYGYGAGAGARNLAMDSIEFSISLLEAELARAGSPPSLAAAPRPLCSAPSSAPSLAPAVASDLRPPSAMAARARPVPAPPKRTVPPSRCRSRPSPSQLVDVEEEEDDDDKAEELTSQRQHAWARLSSLGRSKHRAPEDDSREDREEEEEEEAIPAHQGAGDLDEMAYGKLAPRAAAARSHPVTATTPRGLSSVSQSRVFASAAPSAAPRATPSVGPSAAAGEDEQTVAFAARLERSTPILKPDGAGHAPGHAAAALWGPQELLIMYALLRQLQQQTAPGASAAASTSYDVSAVLNGMDAMLLPKERQGDAKGDVAVPF